MLQAFPSFDASYYSFIPFYMFTATGLLPILYNSTYTQTHTQAVPINMIEFPLINEAQKPHFHSSPKSSLLFSTKLPFLWSHE